MSIDAQSHRLWRHMAPGQRTAFFSCLIVGCLCHLFAFTNIIPNSDGLSRVFDLQQMTVSGRWFLHCASSLNSFTQMPVVIGLLSMLLLGLTAILVVDLLRMQSRVLCAVTGGVMAIFPCMGYTFLYMFTASAYCLAIFLSVLSVWLAVRGRLGWLLGVIALALSMGIYQAYATVAISLSLLVIFRQTMNPRATLSSTFQMGLKLVAYLATGAVLYYGILLLILKVKNLELLSYLGMDAASGGYPFHQLPQLLFQCYKQVVNFFFIPGSANGFASWWMVGLDLIALLLGLIFFVVGMRHKGLWKSPWRVLGAVVIVALLPLGMNFMQILSPYSAPTPLMKYAFLSVYLLVLLTADLVDGLHQRQTFVRLSLGMCVLWSISLMMFCLNTNNLLYTASHQAHRATESYATRLLARIEGCPGYQPGMEIAIVGAVPPEQIKSQIPSYQQVDHYSVPMHSVLPLNKHIYYYLNNWLNTPVDEPSEETMSAISRSSAFRTMPKYPAEGSVQIIHGRVVVRMADEYTPKSDYEIAYENRS